MEFLWPGYGIPILASPNQVTGILTSGLVENLVQTLVNSEQLRGKALQMLEVSLFPLQWIISK